MYKKKLTSIILISFLLLPGCFEAPIEEDNDVFFGPNTKRKATNKNAVVPNT